MTQRLTTTRLNQLCVRYAGLGKLRTQLTALRTALAAKGYPHTTIEGMANQLSDFAFSIDQAIAESTLSATSKQYLTNILLDKINHSYEVYSAEGGTEITNSKYENDYQLLYIPSTATVKAGSCASAFRNCYSLIYISPDVDWTPATSMQQTFSGCGILVNTELTFNLPNCTTIYNGSMPRIPIIHLTNLNQNARLTSVGCAFQSPTRLITGLDFSYVSTNQNAVFNSGNNLSNAEVFLAEGSKIRIAGAVWYFISHTTYNYTAAINKLISTASLWRMLKALYDYNDAQNQTDAQGRALVLTKNSNSDARQYQFIATDNTARRAEIEQYIADNEDNSQTELRAFLSAKGVEHSNITNPADLLSAYCTAKGWTY